MKVYTVIVMMLLFAVAAYGAENAEDSKRFYEKVVQMQPGNANAHFDLGNVYFMEERYADALTHYLEAHSLGLAATRMSNYYFNVSVCYAKLGKTEEAIKSIEACLKIDPGHKDAKDLLVLYKKAK